MVHASENGDGLACARCFTVPSGSFVRALSKVYHPECFTCHDCNAPVASKYFPYNITKDNAVVPDEEAIEEEEEGANKDEGDNNDDIVPLCEFDYFRRLDLICATCGNALRGEYLCSLGKKFHIDHFACCECGFVFGPTGAYYEHDGKVFCDIHFAQLHAFKCGGCRMPILKQCIVVNRGSNEERWHIECFTIYRAWNVTFSSSDTNNNNNNNSSSSSSTLSDPASAQKARVSLGISHPLDNSSAEVSENAAELRQQQCALEESVSRVKSALNCFEESAASCVSSLLLRLSRCQFDSAVDDAVLFIQHVDVTFEAMLHVERSLASHNDTLGLDVSREPKWLCKTIVKFLMLLSKSHSQAKSTRDEEDGPSEPSWRPDTQMTQDYITCITSLTHLVKDLLRYSLAGAFKLERQFGDLLAMSEFADILTRLSEQNNFDDPTLPPALAAPPLHDAFPNHLAVASDTSISSHFCRSCKEAVLENCVFSESNDETLCLPTYMWHKKCVVCCKCNASFLDTAAKLDLTGLCVFSHLPVCPTCCKKDNLLFLCTFKQPHLLSLYSRLLRVAVKYMIQKGNLASLGSKKVKMFENPWVQRDKYIDLIRSHANRKPSADGNSDFDVDLAIDAATQLYTLRAFPFYEAECTKKSSLTESKSISLIANSSTTQSRRLTNLFEQRSSDRSNKHMEHQKFQNPQTEDEIPTDSSPIDILNSKSDSESTSSSGRKTAHPENTRDPKAKNAIGKVVEETEFQVEKNAQEAVAATPVAAVKGPVIWLSDLSAIDYSLLRYHAVNELQRSLPWSDTELTCLLEDKDKAGLWKRIMRMVKRKTPPPWLLSSAVQQAQKVFPTFGVSLEDLVARSGVASSYGASTRQIMVPDIIDALASALWKSDLRQVGVFRKNGNIKRLNDVRELYETDVSLGREAIMKDNAIQNCALLKKFLRELPEPLLTHRLYPLFMQIAAVGYPDKKRVLLKHAVCLLPKANRDTLEVLLLLLRKVAETASGFAKTPSNAGEAASLDEASLKLIQEKPAQSNGNKMDIINISIVLAPTLMAPGPQKTTIERAETKGTAAVGSTVSIPTDTLSATNVLKVSASAPILDATHTQTNSNLGAIETVRRLIEWHEDYWYVPDEVADLIPPERVTMITSNQTCNTARGEEEEHLDVRATPRHPAADLVEAQNNDAARSSSHALYTNKQ